jgi:amino acid transporter
MSESTDQPTSPAIDAPAPSGAPPASGFTRLRRALVGPPRSLHDRGLFHKVSLIALLAWVGLGADGLSSSAYGPEEAFRALGEHRYLAVPLAALMAATVLLISAAYSRIIERFPHGGGGYVVASKLLGPRLGLLSGCALIVDYILTITISIAAAGDALFSFLPPAWAGWKLPIEASLIGGLMLLNIRGVRESVMALAPVFFAFIITHIILIAGGLLGHMPEIGDTARTVRDGFAAGAGSLGLWGMLALLMHAFSLGGGTYTGIEAVSNGVPIMRHPQVRTAKRTMLLMAVSLAFTATGLLVCYLLWSIEPVSGKTMNAVLVERLTEGLPFGRSFVIITLISAAALLVVAAQAGFADGPRVLSNMALDSWAPRRFSALSERLTTQNGIMLMGLAALGALFYTHGDVRHIVVMYSINVFLTFTLSMLAMTIDTVRSRRAAARWRGRLLLFAAGLSLCATILCITVIEKFSHGGWITLVATGSLLAVCMFVRRHYSTVAASLSRTFAGLEKPPGPPAAAPLAANTPPDAGQPVAAVLVAAFNGFGVHTTLNAFRAFPDHFKGVVFISVGVIDSGAFKGEESVGLLREQTERALQQYVDLARRLGIPSAARSAVGTDAVDEAERLCTELAREYPRVTFFAGQVIFRRESWLQRLLHNQTAYAIQRRLQWAGLNLVILPARAW